MYYKHTGETTTEFVDRLCITYGHNKGCVCGKLDPMARGITKVLFDKQTKEMTKHLNSIKTYEFEIIAGVSTNTDDVMGHVLKNTPCMKKDIERVKEFVYNYKAKTEQKFHPVSAIMIRKEGQRRPLWHWNKLDKLTHSELPSKPVTVYACELISNGCILFKDYVNLVEANLTKVSDHSFEVFHIKELIDEWHSAESKRCDDYIWSIKFKMTVSSGFYIRMLAYDINRELGIPVHIYDIYRTDVGSYCAM